MTRMETADCRNVFLEGGHRIEKWFNKVKEKTRNKTQATVIIYQK
jgi:hypothetical protein